MIKNCCTICIAGLVLCAVGCRAIDRSTRASVDPLADIPGLVPEKSLELERDKAARLCVATARKLEENGDELGAIMLYERARAKDPSAMRGVSRRLAVLYDRMGNYQKAQSEFELALALSPNDPELLNNLGYCHYARGKWQLAEESFRRAVVIDGKYSRAWINLGLALGQQEQYESALEAFRNAVSEPEAHSNLAFIYLTQGNTEKARQHYDRALQLDPAIEIARAAIARIDTAPAAQQSIAATATDGVNTAGRLGAVANAAYQNAGLPNAAVKAASHSQEVARLISDQSN